MHAGLDAAEMGQRGDDADRAMATHAEVAGIVEEDDARDCLRRNGRLQDGTDHAFAAARLGDQRSSQPIGFVAEPCQACGHVARAEVGHPLDDHARRLAGSVRVDDADRVVQRAWRSVVGEEQVGTRLNQAWFGHQPFDVVEGVRAIGSEVFDAAFGDDNRVLHANIQLFARNP